MLFYRQGKGHSFILGWFPPLEKNWVPPLPPPPPPLTDKKTEKYSSHMKTHTPGYISDLLRGLLTSREDVRGKWLH